MRAEEISMLMKLGLTGAEAEVYIRLLREDTVTAGELARLTRYSRTKVYEILEKLQREGLVESYPTRPIQFKALDPGSSIPLFVQHKHQELETAENILSRNLSKIWRKAPSQDPQVFINEGINKASAKFLELVNHAEEKIYTFMAWVSKDEYDFLLDGFKKAWERGVKIQMAVYDNPDFKAGVSPRRLAKFSDFSREFYLIPGDFHPFPLPPVKLLAVDEKDINIVFGDYLETGVLKDAISVHYHNISGMDVVPRKIAPLCFETFFGGFRRDKKCKSSKPMS
ncbi:TrmB family transcriptional regulator [Candidatus Pyrohabitans sp.]